MSDGEAMRILLVTTNDRVADPVDVALSDLASLERVYAPSAARQTLTATPYDVVIIDADLTPEGGFSLVREIKAQALMGQAMPPTVLLIARPQDKWLAAWSETDAWALQTIDTFDLREVVEAVATGAPVPERPGAGVPPAAMRQEAHAIETSGEASQVGAYTGP